MHPVTDTEKGVLYLPTWTFNTAACREVIKIYITLLIFPPSSLSCAALPVFSFHHPAAFGGPSAAPGPVFSSVFPSPTLPSALALFSLPASLASAPPA